MRKTTALLPLILLVLNAGCQQKSKNGNLDRLIQNDFDGLEFPSSETFQDGETRIVYDTSFSEVWDSAILVSMQGGVIVGSENFGANGRLLIMSIVPFTVRIRPVDKRHTIHEVTVAVMSELLDPVKKRKDQEQRKISLTVFTNAYLDSIATQLYASQRWAYFE